ncbi:high mobility group box-domain-containing protein [Diplogelasinospora grovesii]|uniref:High mobility group box-domain-containing protein n=1 Tax=Diplogelasinospora grovesii TaxID=303347 RepID=A0AAN6NDY5_9PEZI|nr:high mobility group box-domain-containing protein [Diplogelasinospora grovesii]
MSDYGRDLIVKMSMTLTRRELEFGMQNFHAMVGEPVVLMVDKTLGQWNMMTRRLGQDLDMERFVLVANTSDGHTPPRDANGDTTGAHIRRPRNQFIIFRQEQSAKIRAENPGMTAGAISQIAAKMWRAAEPAVKAHYKQMATIEDANHKNMHPSYRYKARRPHRAMNKRHVAANPMLAAERLIASGH